MAGLTLDVRPAGLYHHSQASHAGHDGVIKMSSPLHDRLSALHTELAATQAVDSESRQTLVALLGDITRLLEKSRWESPPEEPVAERLEALAVNFEAEHPALGTAIRQVVDALGKAGF